MTENKTILALDPGIARTGWAVLQKENQDIQALDYGCIETKSTAPLGERLKTIYEMLVQLIKKYRPETVALEQVFFNTNQKTATVVGQSQGVMILAAAQNNLAVNWVTPLQIKQTLTGYGAADKNQVQKMVMVILDIKKAPKLDDTVDALACGVTYLSQNQLLKSSS